MFDTISLWPPKDFLRKEPIIRHWQNVVIQRGNEAERIGIGLSTLKKQIIFLVW